MVISQSKPRQSPSTAIGIPTPRGHRVRDAAKRRQASITAAAQRRLGREQVERVHVECRRKATEILKRRVRFAVLDFVEIRPPHPTAPGEICLRDPRGPAKAANVGAEHCAERERAFALEQAALVCPCSIHRFHTIRSRIILRSSTSPCDPFTTKSQQATKFYLLQITASEKRHHSR